MIGEQDRYYAFLDRSKIPKDAQEDALSIDLSLSALWTNADDFKSCCDLYIYAHERKLADAPEYDQRSMISWIKIAARGGALAARQSAMMLNNISKLHSPAIRKLWDRDLFKRARRVFNEALPEIMEARNVAAHAGEFAANQRERSVHSLKEQHVFGLSVFGKGANVGDGVHAMPHGLMYGGSFNGSHVSYILSYRVANALAETALLCNLAFENLSVTKQRPAGFAF